MAAHAKASEFTPDNYSFALLGRGNLAGKQFYVLQLSPKRECTELIRGKAWIDADTFLVTRIEGEPAKNPSWWVKNLHLSINYGRADGLWLPLETRATADLRLLGTHTLSSNSVQVQALTENGKFQPAKTAVSNNRRQAPQRVAAAGVWVAQ